MFAPPTNVESVVRTGPGAQPAMGIDGRRASRRRDTSVSPFSLSPARLICSDTPLSLFIVLRVDVPQMMMDPLAFVLRHERKISPCSLLSPGASIFHRVLISDDVAAEAARADARADHGRLFGRGERRRDG